MMVSTQLELEEENLGMMITKAKADLHKAKETGTLATMKMSGMIIPWYVGELANKLEDYKHSVLGGHAKRKPVSAKILCSISSEVIAHHTVHAVINSIGKKNMTITQIGKAISNRIDTEYRLSRLDDDNKKLMKKFLGNSTYRGDRLVKVARDTMNKYHETVMKDKSVSFMRLSLLSIQALAECQPIVDSNIMPHIIEIINTGSMTDMTKQIAAKPWFMEWILNKISNGELITSMHTPMIETPVPWKGLSGGGFHSERFKYNLVQTQVDPSEYYGVDMSNTLNAINRLQDVKWRVNSRILDVMKHCRDNNLSWAELPYNKSVNKSEYPFPDSVYKDLDEEDKVIVKRWRTQSKVEYDDKVSMDSKFMSMVRVLGESQRFKDYEAIYFSYFLDFRGRMYPKASTLHPQTTHYGKALLEFSEGKPIDTIDAEMFLAMQGANTYGNDKDTFINKHKWVLDNEYRIIKCAENPYHPDAMWKECGEDGWLFLAFCFEWADYRTYGNQFRSRIPIAMDGSCNGLQHLSAILLDEVGGKSTNLLDNNIKCDIYTDVMQVAIELLNDIVLQNDTESQLAQSILDFGLTRKAVKRPVMIVPYAGTIRACRKYISEEIVSNGAHSHFNDDFNDALTLYSNTVWEAIGRVVLKGREVMSFLSQLAKDIVKETHSTDISWTTPNGFKVIQRRTKSKSLKLETPMGLEIRSKTFRTTLQIETDKTSSQKHSTGIAPNFIHSLDSCHMQNTINIMGTSSLAMIHDSYGTHAADSRELFDAIRSTFYELYKKGNVLELFISQQPDVPIIDRPTKGTLDLSKVKLSEHFFS